MNIMTIDHYRKPSGRKHNHKAWAYMGEHGTEYAAACTCGFSLVSLTSLEDAEYHATHHWQNGYVKRDQGPEILRTSKGHEVEVRMDDQKVAEVLALMPWSDFAQSLVESFHKYGRWTDGQRPWAHKLAYDQQDKSQREAARASQPKAVGPKLERLGDMLYTAATQLKHPRIVAEIDGNEIRVNIAGPNARVPGSLNVTDNGGFENGQWFGRIVDGEFQPSRNCPDWVLPALVAFNERPEEIARLYGQKYGRCCFCSRELITTESVEAGYGPICADHYGLPWG